MPTARTPVPIVRTGNDLAGVTPDATGDTWVNTGKEFVIIKNGSGSSINVTLDIQATIDGVSPTDPVVAVAAGAQKLMGPFPVGIYNDPSGNAKVTCSAVTSVTLNVLKYQDA